MGVAVLYPLVLVSNVGARSEECLEKRRITDEVTEIKRQIASIHFQDFEAAVQSRYDAQDSLLSQLKLLRESLDARMMELTNHIKDHGC